MAMAKTERQIKPLPLKPPRAPRVIARFRITTWSPDTECSAKFLTSDENQDPDGDELPPLPGTESSLFTREYPIVEGERFSDIFCRYCYDFVTDQLNGSIEHEKHGGDPYCTPFDTYNWFATMTSERSSDCVAWDIALHEKTRPAPQAETWYPNDDDYLFYRIERIE